MSDETAGIPVKKTKRLWQATKWSLLFIVICVAAAAGTALYLIRSPIVVPNWIEARIERRMAQDIPTAKVEFGEMVLIVDDGWRPRIRLQDVSILTLEGAELAAFREVRASFSTRSLLQGQIKLRDLALSGIVADLRRDSDGRVALRASTAPAPAERRAATMPELIGQLDGVLQRPGLSRLRSVDIRALTLHYSDLKSERVWTADGGRLRLNRDGDTLRISADLAVLSGGADVATLAANYTSILGDTAAQFGVTFDGVDAGDIAVQSPAFAWLKVLRAPISGSVRSSIDEGGRFEPLNASLQIGSGAVQPNARAKPIPFDSVRSYFSYHPDQQLLQFDELSVASKWVSGRIEGEATIGGLQDGKLSDLTAQIRMRDLVANPADVYDAPISIEGADLDMQVKLSPFSLTVGRMDIRDADTTLNVTGALDAGPRGWQVALDAGLNEILPTRLLELWPENVKPKTRKWVAENVYAGTLTDVDVAFRLDPDAPPHTYLAFDFNNAEARFLRSMPHLKNASGHASLLKNRFVVSVDSGKITAPQGGDVMIRGSSFIMPDVTIKDTPPGIVRLNSSAPIEAVLALLNLPPLAAMDKADLPVALAEGTADLSGTLSFPIKKGSDPKLTVFDFTGDLRDVQSDVLVKDHRLSADRLTVVASNANITIEGQGDLDGVSFNGGWSQPLGRPDAPSQVQADIELSQNTLNQFNITLPPNSVSGSGRARFALDLAKGRAPSFFLASDLQGLRLNVPQLGWTKPATTKGLLELSGKLGTVPQIDLIEAKVSGLTAKGSVKLANTGGLDRARFDTLTVGNWLDIPVDLLGQGVGKPVQVVVRGGRLDLRNAEFDSSDPSGVKGPPMLLKLDRLQVTDKIALTNMRGQFDTAWGLDGRFEANLNGGTPVAGRVAPKNGRSAIQLVSADAGGVLRSANMLKQVRGGNLTLTLLPVGTGGAFDGRAQITDVAIQDAPAIAALVNAVSVVGLVNELNGDGIYFDTVEADFRMTPNRVTLSEASATGASLGISMDGVYATDTGRMALQGVISPVYLLNGLGSFLTRKGEGLLGFNYSLGGTAENPDVSVNPLSGLAPGFLRNILRAPAPALPPVEGETAPTVPEKPVVRPEYGR
ncbi:AsmA-like C-terminal region [Sulfitobacter marinus]|uniref:AsmA-like C-terminal region n=1 Tax=Sulfitobacter marinus TaxID=394264 RepID=A0A1I6Q7C0_9RHOB|nr:DUF3971 domain-containing protein [Sulfitobacter marinus]SFS48225.1 AsmA-like C-terminal region [Sulfitobacter marinus]